MPVMLPWVELPMHSTKLARKVVLENGGGVAARAGGFAVGDADLPLGHGEAREAVDHQKHVAAAATKGIGDGERELGGAHAHERRIVTGGHDNDRLAQAVPQAVFDERLDFAAASPTSFLQ